MTLDALDRDRGAHAAPPADLDHVAEHLGAGGLTNHAGIERLALLGEPLQHLPGAVDGDAFLVAGDQQADRAVEGAVARAEEARDRRDEGGDRALHVGGTPAEERAVDQFRAEGIDGPGLAPPDRHDVGVASKAEVSAGPAEAGIEVEHRLGARLRELELGAGKSEPLQHARKHVDGALVLGRDAGAADEVRRERRGIDGLRFLLDGHSRRSSLIAVLARVCASTRLTITAQ